MKPNPTKIFAAALALALLGAPIARAQYSPTPQPPPSAPASGADDSAAQARAARSAALRKMLENFTLTSLQKAQINDALQLQRKRMMALHTDSTVTPDNYLDKVRGIIDDTDATLKGIFSPEQFKMWQDATKEMRPPNTVSKPKTNSVTTNSIAPGPGATNAAGK